ncbi:DNA polymerase III subunit alpha [Candidatus Uhrbacteria bacterium]|nr:DNA polymerase III subunit alpha [Candidatus Uhrbacteria bacterium]
MQSRFVNLHTHSHFSLLDGLARIEGLVERAVSFGMTALALTDHGALYGAIEFYKACKRAGIKPIIGVETYLTDASRHDKGGKEHDKRNHLILLVKDEQGYRNLLKLVTSAHLEGFYYRPRVDFELLEKHHDGLIATSACINGPLGQAILEGRDPRPIAQRFLDIFGHDFYFELQHHPHLPDQDVINTALKNLSTELGVGLVATLDSHYLTSDDADAHDVLLCLQTKKEKSDTNRMCMLGEDFSFTDGSALIEAFSDVPSAIDNTGRIAEQSDVHLSFGKTILPEYALPHGTSPEQELHRLCDEGILERYPDRQTADVRVRLDYELGVILKAGFASYFLIVQEFVAWAKRQGIVVGPGRGSAAGSIVAYLLKITNIDPIAYDLYFERFLNPERVSMPDIDLDFADSRRDEVLSYVEEKYGKDHVAQIITFGTMAARVSIRDVGRVLSMPYSFCDMLAKMIPANMTLTQASESVPELAHLIANNPDAKAIMNIAGKLEGVARHTSTHACGVVITPKPLTEYVPCQYASPDDKTIITQYSLHSVEDLGLLKIDFLGLSNLTILENAQGIVRQTRGVLIEYDSIPLDDRATYRLLQDGKTTGVFQLESAGMKRYLKALRPNEMEDIIAMVALYRPGPMDLIPEFIAGKKGIKKPHYLHPLLEPILSKTYGIAVYQEQVMRIVQDLAGFTLGEADVLRKAVGKKISKLLAEQKVKFISGCVGRGISKDLAVKIFEFIEPFAGYGFNRSHAACYALIAYQTAYMKAHYPAEFMAALLTADQHNSDRIAIEIEECRQMGITVEPPDVNESFKSFTVVRAPASDSSSLIRFGLLAIKNIGEHVVDSIVAERAAHGPYASLVDFLERVPDKDLHKKSLESLIRSGALDRFDDRNKMYYNIERMLAYHRSAIGAVESRQASLFGSLLAQKPLLILQDAPSLDSRVRLRWEKELLGLYLTEHPLKAIEPLVRAYVTQCAELASKSDDSIVRVCAIITGSKKVITKKNETMLFAYAEDLSGSVEVIVFPSVYKDTAPFWSDETILAVEGRVSRKDNELKIICSKVRAVDDALLAQLASLAPNANAQLNESDEMGFAHANNYS